MRLYFNAGYLQEIAEANKQKYQNNTPFPHIVIDDLIPTEALDKILEEFPSPEKKIWREYENYHEGKLEIQGEGKIGEFTQMLLYQFNSAPFLYFLETLTGIDNIIPDPFYYGGGLHQIKRGGKLGIHADFSKHGKFPLDRRLNVLIYLNKNWEEDYGGHLELWEKDMSACAHKILPVYNRMVIFNVTDYSYHGHPEPLICPDDRTRKSIALYYFTVGRPEGEVIKGKNSTLFKLRPGEILPKGTILSRDKYTGLKTDPLKTEKKYSLKKIIKEITPPIILKLLKS